MREIKFRAYDKKKKRWVRPELIGTENQDESGKKPLISLMGISHIPPMGTVGDKDVELSEYTGLKDKNGKEIYEGDIILNQWIEMRYGKWLCVNKDDKENRCLFDWLQDNPENTEVIGNIYENPKLLES